MEVPYIALGNWPRIQGYVPAAFRFGFQIDDLVVKIERRVPETLLPSNTESLLFYATGSISEAQVSPRRATRYFGKWYSYFGDQK